MAEYTHGHDSSDVVRFIDGGDEKELPAKTVELAVEIATADERDLADPATTDVQAVPDGAAMCFGSTLPELQHMKEELFSAMLMGLGTWLRTGEDHRKELFLQEYREWTELLTWEERQRGLPAGSRTKLLEALFTSVGLPPNTLAEILKPDVQTVRLSQGNVAHRLQTVRDWFVHHYEPERIAEMDQTRSLIDEVRGDMRDTLDESDD